MRVFSKVSGRISSFLFKMILIRCDGILVFRINRSTQPRILEVSGLREPENLLRCTGLSYQKFTNSTTRVKNCVKIISQKFKVLLKSNEDLLNPHMKR